MAKYPFEYQVYLRRHHPVVQKQYDDFIIGEQIVRGKLILEKNDTDKDKDFYNVRVYKLDYFEPDIPFEGTSTSKIEKEFPDKKFSIGEAMDKYLMFKDETLVCDDVD